MDLSENQENLHASFAEADIEGIKADLADLNISDGGIAFTYAHVAARSPKPVLKVRQPLRNSPMNTAANIETTLKKAETRREQHTKEVRACANDVVAHAQEVVQMVKEHEEELKAKTLLDIADKLHKATMARAAHLDEMKAKAERQKVREEAVKQAREDLSTKLVDEYKDRSVEELDADTVFGMSIDEAAVLLEKEENHKKALEIVIAKCDDHDEIQQFVDKTEIIDVNRRMLIQAIDELLTKEAELKKVDNAPKEDDIKTKRNHCTIL